MGADTKTRILDSAERLFAEHGVDATSLRAVTGDAGTNLAAVNYHFGSKDALIAAVVARRIGPVNQERLKRLEQVLVAAGDEVPEIEPVLEAFLAPALSALREGDRAQLLSKLISRIYWESGTEIKELILEQFHEVLERFGAVFVQILDPLPAIEVAMRFQCAIGVMVHTLSQKPRMDSLGMMGLHDDDADRQLQRLVSFIAAGMRAPLEGGEARTPSAGGVR